MLFKLFFSKVFSSGHKRHFLPFLVLVTAATCFSFSVQKKKRVVFFGDSITQAGAKPGGYIKLLDSLLAEKKNAGFELIGAGISGNKVYDLYLRMEADVLEKKPDEVIIWIGVNDVWHKRTSGTGTDPDKFLRFYEAIISKLKKQGIEVTLCTPAVIGEKTDFSNELDGDLNKYAGFIRGLAAAHQCKIIDLRRLFLDYNLKNNSNNEEKGVLTTDRVHLNYKGNLLVAENMLLHLLNK